jgi:hypothetical protein
MMKIKVISVFSYVDGHKIILYIFVIFDQWLKWVKDEYARVYDLSSMAMALVSHMIGFVRVVSR